jgi:hypothetical protein
MNNAKEQLTLSSIANRDFAVAFKTFTPIFANSQSGEYIKLYLLAQLVSGVIKVKLFVAFDKGTGDDAVFIKSARLANIKCWLP